MGKSEKSGFKSTLCISAIALLGIDFYITFFPEWKFNEQYAYGFFVPFLSLYLIYLRIPQLPKAQPIRLWYLRGLAVFILLSLIPLRIILGANPDWRLALWLYAFCIYFFANLLILETGGWEWTKRLCAPLLLILFSVPWPTFLENALVLELMQFIAIIAVDLLNLFGIFAERHGNVIELSRGLVGIEEACSGVRSFQSTLMAAFFLGALFEWKFSYRIALICFGIALSLSLNITRTLILTWLTATRGGQAMEVLHDPVGHFVSIASYLILFLVTWLIDRPSSKSIKGSQPSIHPPFNKLPLIPLSFSTSLVVIFLIIASHLTTWFWYSEKNDSDAEKFTAAIRWENLEYDVKSTEISPQIRALLRYSEGTQAKWQDADGTNWQVFFFKWDEGSVSNHVTVHRPEVCLPSAGFKFQSKSESILLQKANWITEFESSVFNINENPIYVFYSVWNAGDSKTKLGSTAYDRIVQAWEGQRIRGRYSLQLILSNTTESIANMKAEQFLNRFLSVTSTENKEVL